jgi:hypothetical protein
MMPFDQSTDACRHAFVGVSDHGGWAVLVTVAGNGRLLDRRRVDLVDEHLPKLPHHHEAQRLPLEEALDLVERVRASADRHATLALAAVADAVSSRIAGIALRACPPLPATVLERLGNYRARNVADWVMYRNALAGAAVARGWTIHWYDRKTVFAAASEALQVETLGAHFLQVRNSVGPPWGMDQKLAMAAAIVAAQAPAGSSRPNP